MVVLGRMRFGAGAIDRSVISGFAKLWAKPSSTAAIETVKEGPLRRSIEPPRSRVHVCPNKQGPIQVQLSERF